MAGITPDQETALFNLVTKLKELAASEAADREEYKTKLAALSEAMRELGNNGSAFPAVVFDEPTEEEELRAHAENIETWVKKEVQKLKTVVTAAAAIAGVGIFSSSAGAELMIRPTAQTEESQNLFQILRKIIPENHPTIKLTDSTTGKIIVSNKEGEIPADKKINNIVVEQGEDGTSLKTKDADGETLNTLVLLAKAIAIQMGKDVEVVISPNCASYAAIKKALEDAGLQVVDKIEPAATASASP